jgi:predicted Zn-dependent protease
MSAQAGGQAPPEFLSTHPSSSTRISNLKKWLPEAMTYYNASPYKGKP